MIFIVDYIYQKEFLKIKIFKFVENPFKQRRFYTRERNTA